MDNPIRSTHRPGQLCLALVAALCGCGGVEGDPELGHVESKQAAVKEPARTCSDAFVYGEVLKPATVDSNEPVVVDCSFKLPRWSTVTRRLVLAGSAASGVTIDCNGEWIDHGVGKPNWRKNSIVIKSLRSGSYPHYQFDRPTDVTIKNCNINGAIRVIGMAHNGQGDDDTGPVIRYYSMRRDFTTQARNAAPTRITLDNLLINASERTPLYLAPGVTYTKLLNSEISGSAVAAAVYLDAESAYNTLRGNDIHMERAHRNLFYVRELISIDGSSHNMIINNRFSALNHGGIYLYRNCGEGGTARHATPSRNQIINNVFYYKNYGGLTPAVYLGAKEGLLADILNPHCGEDNHGYYGSSIDDADYARYNVVMQNQIYDRPLYSNLSPMSVAIREGGSKNRPNYVAHNEVVTSTIVRKAGCYVSNGYLKNFILDGETIDVFRNSRGEPACLGYQYKCDDGKLEYVPTPSCSLTKVSRGCRAIGSNNGCRFTASCPAGKRIIAARAACNLEWGVVSSSQLSAVPIDHIRVVRPSDSLWSGFCSLHRTGTWSGTRKLSGIPTSQSVQGSCREHDRNGGDCHISAELYCQGTTPYRATYYAPPGGIGLSN